MKVILDNRIRISLSDVPDSFLQVVRQKFTYKNPEYFKLRNMNYSTKGVSELIKTYKVDFELDEINITRGELFNVIEVLDDFKLDYEFINKCITKNLKDKFTPRFFRENEEYFLDEKQIESVKQCIYLKQGIIYGVTAAGKTDILIQLIAELNQWTLILIHTEKLMTQWKDRIVKAFSIDINNVGQIGYGKFDIKPITISTVQSAHKKVEKLKDVFGCILLDECHHVPSLTFLNSIDPFPAQYRIGATGTLKRKDGKEFLIYSVFGKPIAKITDEYLLELNRIHEVKFTVVPTNFDCREYNKDGEEIEIHYTNDYLAKVILDESRNNLIIDFVEKEVKQNNFCMIMTDRIEHCNLLKQMLNKKKIKTRFLIGGHENKEDGNKAIKEINEGKLHCVIATSVGDEGLDIPKLNRGFITIRSASNEARIKQQAGRFKRVFEGKKDAIIYYFWDYEMYYKDLNKIKKYFGKNNVNVLEINEYENT